MSVGPIGQIDWSLSDSDDDGGSGPDRTGTSDSVATDEKRLDIPDKEDVIGWVATPIFKGFYWLLIAGAAAIGALFLGSDLTLSKTVEGFPGLADLFPLLATWIIQATAPLGDSILTAIMGINVTLVNGVTANTGVLAAPLLVLLQVLELGVLFYLLWAGAQLASGLPVVGTPLSAVGAIVTRPFTALAEMIR